MDFFVEVHQQPLDGFVADWVVLLSDGLERDLVDHFAD